MTAVPQKAGQLLVIALKRGIQVQVVDGEVKSVGKIPSKDEILAWIK